MASRTIATMMKIGLISDEMIPPRRLEGLARAAFSVIAVAYSYFFIHVAIFGPPVQEVFKGTYFLGVVVMGFLLYKARQKAIRERFVWLDEFFALANLVMLCGALVVWAHWTWLNGQLGDAETLQWRRYAEHALVPALLGGLLGAALYLFEALRPRRGAGLALSDVLFLVGATAAVLWWGINLVELTERIGAAVITPLVFFSFMLAAASFEIARRVLGPIIPLIGAIFFVYCFDFVAEGLPEGILQHPGFRMPRVMEFLMLSTEGMLGLIVETFAVYIVIFVILGAFLEKTGFGALIIDTAYRITGRQTGGPGLAAVISSGFFGMISGSPVANTVTTGTFTIPLMKRVGYRGEFAGAVEAAASTGGSFMPPIMGAGAFLLAELTSTPYSHVIAIAVVPALLYYLTVGLIVYFRARRFGLHGVPASELPSWSIILPRLHLLLPIPAMVYLLVAVGDSPFLAAAKTIILIILLKAADLLNEVPLRQDRERGKLFLGIAVLVGVLVYLFGMDVGAPFSWFVEDYVGINIVDAGFWAVAAYIVLKIAEIAGTGTVERRPSTVGAASAPHIPGVTADDAGSAGVAGLGDVVVQLVKAVWSSMEAGARNTIVVSCIAGVLGILLATATQSNLPGRVSDLLEAASFGLLPLTIFWVIVAGYIVGMGLPITASYVILAVFAVTALTGYGVPVLAAHMICYWLAVVSSVTPPVALAAYAGAAIANSDPVKTGTQAVKLASMIFIMPFLFVYTPVLLIEGTTVEFAVTVAASSLGALAWALFLETRPAFPFGRALMGFAAFCLLMPMGSLFAFLTGLPGTYLWPSYAIGALLTIVLVIAIRLVRGSVVVAR